MKNKILSSLLIVGMSVFTLVYLILPDYKTINPDMAYGLWGWNEAAIQGRTQMALCSQEEFLVYYDDIPVAPNTFLFSKRNKECPFQSSKFIVNGGILRVAKGNEIVMVNTGSNPVQVAIDIRQPNKLLIVIMLIASAIIGTILSWKLWD